MIEIVDYYADWCPPCRKLKPVLEDVEKELGGRVKVRKVNVDEDREEAIEMGIGGIPTIVFFKNGKEVDRMVGPQSKQEIIRTVEKHE